MTAFLYLLLINRDLKALKEAAIADVNPRWIKTQGGGGTRIPDLGWEGGGGWLPKKKSLTPGKMARKGNREPKLSGKWGACASSGHTKMMTDDHSSSMSSDSDESTSSYREIHPFS
jgi:hypothetical protein